MSGRRALAAAALAALASLAAPAGAGEPDPAAVLAELPFLEALPNQVKIDLGAKPGRPLPLLLDTGALHSFATAGGARAIGIPVRRNKQTPYKRSTCLGHALELHVDTRRGETGVAAGGDYALVGAPFLARYVVEIDFPGRRVRFLDPDAYEVPAAEPEAAVLRMRPGSLQPIVEIEVGRTLVPAILATGAPGTLILPGGWAAAADAAVREDREETARLELPPGSGPMQAAVAARVGLGGFEERDVPLLVAPDGVWGQGPRSEALLGVDFLKRFVLRIDYPRGRLWIRDPKLGASGPPPVSAPPPAPAPSPPEGEPPRARTIGVG